MSEKWTADAILDAMEEMKARFLQNADYLFCNPEDEEELKKDHRRQAECAKRSGN